MTSPSPPSPRRPPSPSAPPPNPRMNDNRPSSSALPPTTPRTTPRRRGWPRVTRTPRPPLPGPKQQLTSEWLDAMPESFSPTPLETLAEDPEVPSAVADASRRSSAFDAASRGSRSSLAAARRVSAAAPHARGSRGPSLGGARLSRDGRLSTGMERASLRASMLPRGDHAGRARGGG